MDSHRILICHVVELFPASKHRYWPEAAELPRCQRGTRFIGHLPDDGVAMQWRVSGLQHGQRLVARRLFNREASYEGSYGLQRLLQRELSTLQHTQLLTAVLPWRARPNTSGHRECWKGLPDFIMSSWTLLGGLARGHSSAPNAGKCRWHTARR